MEDKNIQNIAHNLQKVIEEIDNIKQYIEENRVSSSFDANAASKKSHAQSRIEYLLNYLCIAIDKKASQGLFEHKETFKCTEEPTISQADLLAIDLELKGFRVTLDSIEDNKVKEIHIDWS